MVDILAENLSEKEVMGSDGASLGTLYNITMDLKTGTLQDLVIEPGERAGDLEFERDEQGNYRIPVSRVQAVKDTVVVAR
ncbi:PRC domain protein [Natronomonas pharaonis DSM 2160]|uniref:PRC domain protein n=1 Tax=Natronomonas pharaonis (strain ATCC 35678 / DSM 2160 / CIP 103997 / JCM 8858 / NBRC 14720 / NCIMB 2260 / Gabara) TaxID=348780 RepID=A0A1U7EZ54_NATPD|nr:PRC-barrel domain-containing protein [Natronomonas pharaonis]CAI50583.1 PRC domain protein [Natronomonas pharaonis DSM 2160]